MRSRRHRETGKIRVGIAGGSRKRLIAVSPVSKSPSNSDSAFSPPRLAAGEILSHKMKPIRATYGKVVVETKRPGLTRGLKGIFKLAPSGAALSAPPKRLVSPAVTAAALRKNRTSRGQAPEPAFNSENSLYGYLNSLQRPKTNFYSHLLQVNPSTPDNDRC